MVEDYFNEGEIIALSDSSGTWTTGPHLHYEVRYKGVLVDPLLLQEEDKVGKLAAHVQLPTDWDVAVINQYWQGSQYWVKKMVYRAGDPPLVGIINTNIVVRPFCHEKNSEWEAACVAKGAAGGHEIFNFLRPIYEFYRGKVKAWEFTNEPDLSGKDAAALQRAFNYAAALDAWRSDMDSAGFPTCGGSISVGNTMLQYYDYNNDVLKIIAPALSRCKYDSYHAYWKRPYQSADLWWAHRYRLITSECAAMGITLPPWLLTEAGNDGNSGWHYQYGGDFNLYFADLKKYAEGIQGDANVIAAFLFDVGSEATWMLYDHNQAQLSAIGEWNATGQVVIPPHEGLPSDETTTDPIIMSEKIRWWSEESQRQFEAGNFAYANRIRLSNIALCYKLEITLKSGG